MARSGTWIGKWLLALGLVALHAGTAQATGSGYGGWGGHGGPGGSLDETFTSGDGLLEFSDFRFRGIDPDDVTITPGESGIRFSGDESISGWGLDKFKITYTVRSLTDLGIIGTSLELDSEVDTRFGLGGVVAKKRISAPREAPHELPWLSLDRWDDENGDGRHPWRGKRGHASSGWGHHGSEHIGTLYAFELSSGWICGCGHHHARADEVENECRIERDSDSIEYDPESELRIEDTVKLFSVGKGEVSWSSISNDYVLTPEPGTAGLLGLGLAGLVASRRRRELQEERLSSSSK